MTSAGDLIARGQVLLERQQELASRWVCSLPVCDGLPHAGWLHHHARTEQREPDDYEVWMILTGRGWGKSRTGAETVKGWARDRRRHIAVLGKTDRETRNVCFEGPAGLLSVIPERLMARDGYRRSGGDTSLTLTNGTVFRAFSSERPEALRGYAFDGAWFDEYAAWPVQTAQDCWDNVWFCLREAKYPHLLVTTTPRNLPHVKDALKQASVITRGSTLANAANLSPAAVEVLRRKYEGTRLGRQELSGELVEDVEGALWTLALIEASGRVEVLPEMWRVVVGVDPAGTANSTSDETGIVVVGAAGPRDRPEFYVLEDGSGRYSPDEWAKKAIYLYDKWGADAVAAEQNNGWDMVNATLRHQDERVRIRKMIASRGKYIRAEPIVALYEQFRVHHHGVLIELEDQMVSWTPMDTKYSPDRLDALVWAATELSAGPRPGSSFGGSLMAQESLTGSRIGW